MTPSSDHDRNISRIWDIAHDPLETASLNSLRPTVSPLSPCRLAHAALRREWDAVKREYYARKAGFDPNQPRVPAGSSEGGQWTDSGAGTAPLGGQSTSGDSRDADREKADMQDILARAKHLAASSASMNRCIDLCYPLLERFKRPGSDKNETDFRKCLNACLGLNR